MASQAIGIDIGSHAVKVAVLQRKGAVTKALRLFRAPVAGDTDPARAQGALKRSGVTGGPGMVGISGRDLIIRYTHVPPVPDWRLKLLMQFEINEVSGQSGGEVAADYRRLSLPVEADDDTVLVSLARNTWLAPRLDAVRGAGIRAGGGCPCSVAAFNAFLHHGDWKEGETTYIVAIGRENIDMAIQRDGELLFARNMAGGGHMFTEAIMSTFGLREPKSEKNKVTKGDLTPKSQARYPDATAEKLANAMQGPAGQLVSMIQSSVMIGRAQTKIADLNVDRIVLTGGTAAMKGIQQYFAANMSVPVEIFDPVQELDTSGLDPQDAEGLGDRPTDFTVAIGLAETLLQPSSFRLEVLTESEKRKRRFVERSVWALGAAAAALVLVVMLFNSRAAAIADVRAANERITGIRAQNKQTDSRQKSAMAGEKDARLKDVALRCRRYPLQFTRAVLGVLFANHGEHIYLTRIAMDTKKVSLGLSGLPTEGRATSGSDSASLDAVHAQQVWPELEVAGKVQIEFTTNPGRTLNTYYNQLRAQFKQINLGGFGIEMRETGLDATKGFSIKFSLKKLAEPKEKG